MSSKIQRTRKAIVRAVGRTRKGKRFSLRVLGAIKNRYFPLGFFIRNILTLQGEAGWKNVSPRIRRGRLQRMLEERSRVFLEVYHWRSQKLEKEPSPRRALPLSPEILDWSGYCSHCGGCCEIASGFPDFPAEAEIPFRWQQLFGNGLGKGHRFCAFLWEIDASGLSLCAIHPWRSHPCRTFEEAECAFFKNDLEEHPLYHPQDFSMACQRLSRLIDRR